MPSVFEKRRSKYEKAVGEAFLASVQSLRSSTSLTSVTAALTNEDVDLLLSLIRPTDDTWTQLQQALTAAYQETGTFTMLQNHDTRIKYVSSLGKDAPAVRDTIRAILNGEPAALATMSAVLGVDQDTLRKVVAAPSLQAAGTAIVPATSTGILRVGFDTFGPDYAAYMADLSSRFIVEVNKDIERLVREHVKDALAEGRGPRDLALDLVGRIGKDGARSGGVLGLTSQQAQWVRNARVELFDATPASLNKYLGRALRDKRFDRYVRRAIKTGEKIPASIVADMTQSYSNRMLFYRGTTIARTETMAAMHRGQYDAMRQYTKAMLLEDDTEAVWNTSADGDVRDSHQAMEGEAVNMGEAYQLPSGVSLMYPGDPNGPVEEIANCRCWQSFRMRYPRVK